ncbi:hypothetical protein C8R46DRAFT_1237044 [Mycena filopes]|nr:hypothetical protein C8R46DRAFT_1237044 [Mycena filopes]
MRTQAMLTMLAAFLVGAAHAAPPAVNPDDAPGWKRVDVAGTDDSPNQGAPGWKRTNVAGADDSPNQGAPGWKRDEHDAPGWKH